MEEGTPSETMASREEVLASREVKLSRLYALLLGRILCCVIFLLAIASPVLAQEAGRVVSIVGTAEVLWKGQWQPIRIGEALAPGEVMRTGPGSRVAVQLLDCEEFGVRSCINVALHPFLSLCPLLTGEFKS